MLKLTAAGHTSLRWQGEPRWQRRSCKIQAFFPLAHCDKQFGDTYENTHMHTQIAQNKLYLNTLAHGQRWRHTSHGFSLFSIMSLERKLHEFHIFAWSVEVELLICWSHCDHMAFKFWQTETCCSESQLYSLFDKFMEVSVQLYVFFSSFFLLNMKYYSSNTWSNSSYHRYRMIPCLKNIYRVIVYLLTADSSSWTCLLWVSQNHWQL